MKLLSGVIFFVYFMVTISFSFAQDVHSEVKNGDLRQLKNLLEKAPDLVNKKNQNNETPLILASKYGHIEIVKLLVSKGANLNTQDKNGWSSLHYAAWSSAEIAQLLISKGADVDLRSVFGESPLFEYINMGNQEMAELLLSKGADINSKNNRGETPLHRAAGEGNKKMVDFLISQGAEINTTTDYSFTPLHFAAVFGHKETVECLIEYGAELNIKSNDRGTPLHFAGAAGYKDIADLLKTKGAGDLARDYPVLEGDYFDLKKPGQTPELFAPDILYNISIFVSFCFSPDRKEVYFSLASQHFNNSKIWFMKQENGRWLPPRRAPFSGEYSEGSPFISPDGKRLFFYSNIPLTKTGQPKKDLDIWMVEREGGRWGEPINLGSPVNTDGIEATSYVSRQGNLYFHRFDSQGTRGSTEIFMARLDDDGNYSILEKVNDLNTEFGEAGPYVSPEENFIIFHSNRPGGFNGLNDLYVSYSQKEGGWVKPKNMGKMINSFPSMSAYVSPDGKYLFFTSMRNGIWGTFWMDAKIIEELKPKASK